MPELPERRPARAKGSKPAGAARRLGAADAAGKPDRRARADAGGVAARRPRPATTSVITIASARRLSAPKPSGKPASASSYRRAGRTRHSISAAAIAAARRRRCRGADAPGRSAPRTSKPWPKSSEGAAPRRPGGPGSTTGVVGSAAMARPLRSACAVGGGSRRPEPRAWSPRTRLDSRRAADVRARLASETAASRPARSRSPRSTSGRPVARRLRVAGLSVPRTRSARRHAVGRAPTRGLHPHARRGR